MGKNAFDILQERGFINQVTDEEGVRDLLDTGKHGPQAVYCGFDPTASSMQLGNLVPTFALAHLQRAGHRVLVVLGGATGMIGDPSGKSAERVFIDEDTLKRNVETMREGYGKFIDFDDRNGRIPATILNNYDWTHEISIIDWLRGIGKQFTVNYMVAKESVRARFEDRDQGISYTEFSYMLLQAHDFAHLYSEHACLIQVGGGDQWGNITAGTDLIGKYSFKDHKEFTEKVLKYVYSEKKLNTNISTDDFVSKSLEVVELLSLDHPYVIMKGMSKKRKKEKILVYLKSAISAVEDLLSEGNMVFEHHLGRLMSILSSQFVGRSDVPQGLTFPLVTTASGQKLGKSEGGTVYLDTAKTSIWDFYQYLIRTDDRDVIKFLKLFTFLPMDEIAELEKQHEENPGARIAHKRLAWELTSLVHGQDQAERMVKGAEALYAGRLEELDADLIRQVFSGGPVAEVAQSALDEGVPLVDLAADAGLVASKGEGRRMLKQGALYVNDERAGADQVVTAGDILPSGVIVLRRGKKDYLLVQPR